ncbi:MAG TPA: FG-GAP-like repeat-containing protein [Planctomycetota bacterium]|jgi:glyoxylase-like metal-dependent hydrolase (beta-lactamase superfamily II)
MKLRGTVLLVLACSTTLGAVEGIQIGTPLAQTLVPPWDARGVGLPPAQAIACLDISRDGRFVAVGTTAAPGVPNLFVLDENGKLVAQHRAGHRWLNEVALSDDGSFAAALCTIPEGTAGDTPQFFGFHQGKALAQLSDRFKFRDFRPAGFMFHYGEHSNHIPNVSHWAGGRWVVAGDDVVHWLPLPEAPPAGTPAPPALDETRGAQSAHLGAGVTTAFAASPSGVVAVGRFVGQAQRTEKFRDLLLLNPKKPGAIVWSREPSADAAVSPEPEKGVYGPATPPYRDVKFVAPLALALSTASDQLAVADYAGWQRVFSPRDGSDSIHFGTRFMPSRPTIHIYDAAGKTIRRIGPESFSEPFWCDLTFSPDGSKLLIWPHNWASRGLGGQPLLPADEKCRTLYVLDIASGALQASQFPDAIASVGVSAGTIAVGCWDHKVYLLDSAGQPKANVPQGVAVGAVSLVRAAAEGKRIVVATTAGCVQMLDGDGKLLWKTDLNAAAQDTLESAASREHKRATAQKPKPGSVGPRIWRTNHGQYHSDLGSQLVIEAPQGLLMIDPNAGGSFARNWALIEGAGLDPMRLKYVLLTHEHGDHAPGACLWRLATGAQVVASAESAYLMQHHMPGGTGYGFHPPQPVDIVIHEDKDLDLAGLKVRAIRLPGHTYGSMGYLFEEDGKTYVATGDLIMPGGVLGYSGSLDFSAQDVLSSLRKLAAIKPDVVLGGHGGGGPDEFIAKGIEAGEQTGWSKMTPTKPNPLCRFTQTNYLVAAWLEPIIAAAYGDFDGDGRPDVAVLVAKGKGSLIKVYLNKGGKFANTPDAEVDLPELQNPWKLRTIQLSKGKRPDFFVSSEGLCVLLLAQEEPLKFKHVPLLVTRGCQVANGDFSGSGRTDLLIGSRFVSGVSLACQQEDGTFKMRQINTSAGYMDMAVADVNGDGRTDLILSNGDIFLRQADGSLSPTPSLRLKPPLTEQKGWTWLAAADFDHDGSVDVALLAGGTEGACVWLYRNTKNAEAPFAAEPSPKLVVPATDVCRDGPTVADLNGDGIPDLILHSRGEQGGVVILSGSATDGLSAQRVLPIKLDYGPHFDTRFGVADFNGDGRPDLAGFGRAATGALGVYIWLQPNR